MARTGLVIFDFDGTLVDTAPDLITATNLWLAGRGLPEQSDARIRAEIGLGLRRFLIDVYPDSKSLSPEERRELDDEFTLIYEQQFLTSPRCFEGVERFLGAWEGQLAIVSNKRERFITPLIKHLGLDRYPWAAIIGGDTFDVMKPDAKPFLAAMAAAGADPEETVVVGDGEPDVEGAARLGIKSIACAFGYAPIERLMDLGAWRRLDHFDDLNGLIARAGTDRGLT